MNVRFAKKNQIRFRFQEKNSWQCKNEMVKSGVVNTHNLSILIKIE